MRKILFITDFFGPEPGGMENFNTGLAHGVDDIVVLVTSSSGFSDEKARQKFDQASEYRIYRISVPIPNFLVPSSKRNLSYVQKFQDLLQSEQPTHILLGNLYGKTSGLVPLIYRGALPYSIILQPFDIDQLSLFHLNLHRFIKKASNLFVFSNYFKELAVLKGLTEEGIISVPFGLHARWDRRNTKRKKSKTMEALQRFENRFRILSMGPLTRDKNLDRVFRVIEQLDKKGIDRSSYVWFIVGSGPEHGYLKEMIHLNKLEDTVVLVGFLDDVEVGVLFYYSDLYFHPGGEKRNQASGYSASLLEAGYTSLPVVAGRGAGVEEIVKHQVTGMLHQPDDYASMAESIIDLSRDPELRNRMGRFGEDRVLVEYDIERSRHQIFQRL